MAELKAQKQQLTTKLSKSNYCIFTIINCPNTLEVLSTFCVILVYYKNVAFFNITATYGTIKGPKSAADNKTIQV